MRHSELLKKAWDQAVALTDKDNTMLVLMESRGIDMPGAIVPPEYLYGFHKAFPHLSHLDPLHHVSRGMFSEDFENLKGMLRDGHSLVVLDDRKHPAFGVANWGFAFDLLSDEQGHVRFRDEFAKYAFTGEVYRHEPDPEAEERFRSMFGDWKPPAPPVMSEADARIVQEMIERLSLASPGRASYAQTVRSAEIDLS